MLSLFIIVLFGSLASCLFLLICDNLSFKMSQDKKDAVFCGTEESELTCSLKQPSDKDNGEQEPSTDTQTASSEGKACDQKSDQQQKNSEKGDNEKKETVSGGQTTLSEDQTNNEACSSVKEKPKNQKKGSKKSKGTKGASAADFSFPNTLAGFGYEFINGELRNIETKERFIFEVRKGDKEYNQKHYEALGEVITEEVYTMLETIGNLQRIPIPVDKKQKDASSFFFASGDAFINPNKLMILIHGSGVVRAGQWARRLIINDCLDTGTQLPFIKRAAEEGYGVVVTNTNRNEEEVGGKKLKIKGSKTPEEHAQYLWKHFISKASAKEIFIVAHSYGGVVTVELLKAYSEDFKKRVVKIAFTDSVHNLDLHNIRGSTRRWIVGNACNWVTNPEPLDTPLMGPRSDVIRVSAGTLKHEETSFYSFESIFKYFSSRTTEI